MVQMPCSGQIVKVSQKSTWHYLGYTMHGQYIPQEHLEMFTQLTTEMSALISNDAASLSFATNSSQRQSEALQQPISSAITSETPGAELIVPASSDVFRKMRDRAYQPAE